MEQLEVVEKWGDSVDQAVDLALRDMKLSREEVEVEVLEEPSRGFLGIVGQKLARVKVTKKGVKEEVKEEKHEKSFEPVMKKAPEETAAADEHQERRWKKNTNKKPLSELIDTEESLTPEASLEELDFHKQMKELPSCEEHPALTFLGDVIQDKYLTSLVVNKEHEGYTKVVIDAEDYRSRREKTLEQLADKMARKAIKSHRSLKLDPMNPYERKVIHATLQKNPRVTTRSEGQDPYRRVVIEPKH